MTIWTRFLNWLRGNPRPGVPREAEDPMKDLKNRIATFKHPWTPRQASLLAEAGFFGLGIGIMSCVHSVD